MNKGVLKSIIICLVAPGSWLAILLSTQVIFALDLGKPITQYNQSVWQIEDGLPQNSVRTIAQGADGYLWLGTDEGLVRFDGVRFTIFDRTNTREIPNNKVGAVLSSTDGSLWIGGYGGLTRFKDGRFTLYTTENGLSNDIVTTLFEDSTGALWIGTDSGINQFKDGRFASYARQEGLSDNRVRSIAEDKDGSLLIVVGGSGRLTRLKDGKFRIYTSKDGLPDQSITTVYRDRQNNIWVGTSRGLCLFREERAITYTTKDGLSSNNVDEIWQDQDGNLWIGTIGGGLNRLEYTVADPGREVALRRYDNQRGKVKFTAYTTKEGLSSDDVQTIFEDREGILWVGTGDGGLNRFKDGKFITYTKQGGLFGNVVYSVYEHSNDGLWIGGAGGISLLKDGQLTTWTGKDGLPDERVMMIFASRDSTVWIGTEGSGLIRFKDKKFTAYTTKNGLSNDIVRAIYEDREGALWIGTSGGLNRLKDGKFTTYSTKDGLSNEIIYTILQAQDGALWLGTRGGINIFKDGKFTAYTTKEGLSYNIVYSLYQDSDGVIWAGTRGGGLNRLKDGRITTYTTNEGLFDDVAFQILEDNQKNLWISCNKGVFRVRKQDLNDFAEGRISSVTSISYGIADGMKSNECNGSVQYAGYKTSDGRLCFPTIKGLAVIAPENIKLNTLLPPVYIEQALIDGKSVDPNGQAQVPPGKGELEFHYTGLNFLAPEKVRFKYKLEGFDKDWIEAGTRRIAYYTNIPPGSYHFRVIACNNDGIWNETGAGFNFYLKPHFYQTYWFYTLCALALALLAAAGVGLRISQLKAREKELARRVEEAVAKVKVLSGLLPICASCKNIRDDRGYYVQIESYIKKHSNVDFSHSICPKCARKLYPEYVDLIYPETMVSADKESGNQPS